MIRATVPSGQNRSSALAKFNTIVRLVNRGSTADAQRRAVDLMDFLLNRYRSGALGSTTDPVKRAQLENLLDGILCLVGLPPAFGGALGPDGAAALIFPTTPDTTVVTGTKFAGVHVPSGSVAVPTFVTIRRLPDAPHPLLTELDQYPLFYEYHASPTSAFTTDLLVGVCVAESANPPDASRLRLAHNVPPFTAGSIEILPLATAGFLDCTNADLALLPSGARPTDLALAGTRMLFRVALDALLPAKAYAAGVGLGGTTRGFSPFGAVDTLGVMTATVVGEAHAWFGDAVANPPAVRVLTPTGQPMAGVPVTFAVTAGASVLSGGGTMLTDANGYAVTTSWVLNAEWNTVHATATAPAGAGFSNNPLRFLGIGHPR